jgi:hypothetical protein
MIGKVITGKSFGGCVRYVVQKQDAEILYAEGVRAEHLNQTIGDFDMQRKINPDLGKAVGHIALSWSARDQLKLNNEMMVDVAREYLERMKIHNTQFLIVKHHDKNHPHVHIVYNRINNEGKTISDAFQHKRNASVCKELTSKYGFYLAKDKAQVNRQQLKGEDRVKYELFDKIKSVQTKANNLNHLKLLLASHGIEMLYKYKGNSNEIQGVTFRKEEYSFKGSDIDRTLSYGNLKKSFEQVDLQQKTERLSLGEQLRQVIAEKTQPITTGVETGPSFPKNTTIPGTSILGELFSAVPQIPEPEFPGKKKKKRKGQEQCQGIRR